MKKHAIKRSVGALTRTNDPSMARFALVAFAERPSRSTSLARPLNPECFGRGLELEGATAGGGGGGSGGGGRKSIGRNLLYALHRRRLGRLWLRRRRRRSDDEKSQSLSDRGADVHAGGRADGRASQSVSPARQPLLSRRADTHPPTRILATDRSIGRVFRPPSHFQIKSDPRAEEEPTRAPSPGQLPIGGVTGSLPRPSRRRSRRRQLLLKPFVTVGIGGGLLCGRRLDERDEELAPLCSRSRSIEVKRGKSANVDCRAALFLNS